MVPTEPDNGSFVDDEAISPELVLVSPELAAHARALLPDPPREERAEPSRYAAAPPVADEEPPPGPVDRRSPSPGVRLAPLLAGAAAIVVFSVGVAVGTRGSNDAPILLAEQTEVARTAGALGTSTALTTPARARRRATPTRTAAPTAASTSGVGVPTRPRPALKPLRPVEGGYVWARGSRFLATGAGTRVEQFEFTTSCGPSLLVPTMPVDAKSRFGFRGRVQPPGGGPPFGVAVEGRWIGPETVRGRVSYSSPTCSRRLVAYVARLS